MVRKLLICEERYRAEILFKKSFTPESTSPDEVAFLLRAFHRMLGMPEDGGVLEYQAEGQFAASNNQPLISDGVTSL